MNPVTLLLVGGGVAVLLLIVGLVLSLTGERTLVEERLEGYLGEDDAETAAAAGERPSPVTDWLNRRMERSSWGENIARELARADLKLRPGEYLALIVISALGSMAIAYLVFHHNVLFALGGLIAGLFLPRFYVKRQQNVRLQRFNDQLPDMLNLVVNGLRAGFSTMQALEAVSRELPDPISSEFRRVVQEMQLGIPMEKALDNLLRRIPSDDLDLIVTAINVQREVGGNLAEILETIAYTIRERIRIKGEIKTLVTQVLYSGRLLALMPFGLAMVLYAINPNYVGYFFKPKFRLCGFTAIGTVLIMISTGYYIMTRIMDIEV